jgi:cell division protein FtsB
MDRRWLHRIAGAALLAGLAAYLPHRVQESDGYVRMTRMQEELGELDRRALSLRRENQTLRGDIRRLRVDLEAIDRVARDDLGLVQPEEIVIQVERGP